MTNKFIIKTLNYFRTAKAGMVEGHKIAEGFDDVSQAISKVMDRLDALETANKPTKQ